MLNKLGKITKVVVLTLIASEHDNYLSLISAWEGSLNLMARGRSSRQTIYDRLDEAIADLRTRMGGLPSPAEAEAIWDELWHQEAHHSTALEGNTLASTRSANCSTRAAQSGPRN